MQYLIFFTIIVFIAWFFLGSFIYETIDAKRRTVQIYPEQNIIINNMYRQAQLITRSIGACETYDAICAREEDLIKFRDTYQGTPGFDDAMRDLLKLMQQAKRLARLTDKYTVAPFDARYSPE